MVGAVRGIDPETGHYFDDTKRYIDALDDLRPTTSARSSRATRAASIRGSTRMLKARGLMSAGLVQMDAGWLDLASHRRASRRSAAAGRGGCALPRVRAGRRVSLCARAQVHARAMRRRKSCWRCAISSASSATSSCRRTCHGADNRALVDALRSVGRHARAASRRSSATSPTRELQALHAAGVRGVRFNFVKRLVDVTPRRGAARDRASASSRSAGTSSIYFEAQDLPELVRLLRLAADRRGGRSHGPAGCDASRSTGRSSSCS